jgi:hypothetical protein
VGLALQPEEEALRSQLEALQNQLNAPAQFKVEHTMKQMSNIREIQGFHCSEYLGYDLWDVWPCSLDNPGSSEM